MGQQMRVLAVVAALLAAPAQAISVAGFDFAPTAFVDQVTGFTGGYVTFPGGSVEDVLTDKDVLSAAGSRDQGAFIDLAFVDNHAVNGVGNDIVLFELGDIDGWRVTIAGLSREYFPVFTGFGDSSLRINAAAFDLADFGIAAGGTVSALRIAFFPPPPDGAGNVASTSLVGALNSMSIVPEPASWMMLLAGFALSGLMVRRQRLLA